MKRRSSAKRRRAGLPPAQKTPRKQSLDSSPSGDPDPDGGLAISDDDAVLATSRNPYEERGVPGTAATVFATGCANRTHCAFCAEFRRMSLKQWLMLSFNPTPLADAFSDAGALLSSSAPMHFLAHIVAPLSPAHTLP
jgi:hypothetical protein